MRQLILFGICFVMFSNEQEIKAVRELYGQPSGRIRSSPNNINPVNLKEYAKQQYQLSRTRDISPTFSQARRFHSGQLGRDNRNLRRPSSYSSQPVSPHHYSYSGVGANIVGSSQEGCHLANSYCSGDYQCCSGKCRCVRWSVIGKMSCYKKCF